jgi:NTE family protein
MFGLPLFFRDGDLVKPLMASAAVPIVCQPIIYQEHVLVDGGLLNNLPVECLIGECEFIIGVNCNPINHDANIASLRGMMERTFHLAINNNVEPRLKMLDFLIEPPQLKYFSLLNLKKSREMFNAGYDHTLLLEDNLNMALKNKSIKTYS